MRPGTKTVKNLRHVGEGGRIPMASAPTTPGNPSGDKKFRAAAVVGQPADAHPVRAASQGSFKTKTTPTISMGGMVGLVLLVLAVLGLVLNLVLPWLAITAQGDGEGQTLDRGEAKALFGGDDGPGYFKSLLWWPLLAFGFLMGIGLGLFVIDLVPMWLGVKRSLQAGLGVLGAYFGFLVALTGFRWLGFYINTIWDSGPTPLHLHVVPYLNLVIGLVALGGCAFVALAGLSFIRAGPDRGRLGAPARRTIGFTIAVVAVSLMLFPMLPFGSEKLDGASETDWMGEAGLAGRAEFGNDDQAKPGKDLGFVRMMLWIAGYASIAAFGLALVERTGSLPTLWGALTTVVYGLGSTVAVIVGTIFTILLYVHIPGMGGDGGGLGLGLDYSLAFNYFPILTMLGLIAMAVMFAVNVIPRLMAQGVSGPKATTF